VRVMRKLDTPQIQNTTPAPFSNPFPNPSDIHEKDPAIEENRVFWGCNIRRISVEYGDSFLSHEHQFPIILWVRIDGLNELGYRTSHQVGFIDLIIVTDGGHFVLENDG
jgi:hypothetical protein